MGVNVDDAGRDPAAGRVDDGTAGGIQPAADAGNPAVDDQHILA